MTEKMTETERLRALLDGRGVVWGDRFAGESQSRYTRYEVDSGMSVTAWEDTLTGKLSLSVEIDYRLTPEQAIEATLGRGTCHDVAIEGEWFECSECGTVKQLIHPNYCPRCGRRVES